ncbi:hypothetical protein TNCV_3615681 [Trichonephila clavipes]|nr:hypothetical protein TNCV_3615681 [Trichonephila clavipes]
MMQGVVRTSTGSRCLCLAVVCVRKYHRSAASTHPPRRGSVAINQMCWAARKGETGEPVSFPSFRPLRRPRQRAGASAQNEWQRGTEANMRKKPGRGGATRAVGAVLRSFV